MKVDNQKFENIRLEAARIQKAKHYLFVGEPYRTEMKLNKYKTYRRLCKLQDMNIKKMGALFGVGS